MEIKTRKITGKSQNTQKIQQYSSKQHMSKRRNCSKYFELTKIEKAIHPDLWYIEKAALKGKFIPLNVYIIKEKLSEINNLGFHLSKLEKDQIFKSKTEEIKEKLIKLKTVIFSFLKREN